MKKQGMGRRALCVALVAGLTWLAATSAAAAQTAAAPSIIQLPYPSGAMLPTIHPGDVLDIDTTKLKPKRGDIVVFDFPGYLCESDGRLRRSGDQSCSNPEQPVPPHHFVMRVVAMPGDRFEIHGDTITIDGKPVSAEQVGPFEGDPRDDHERTLLEMGAVVWKEHLPGADHQVARAPQYSTPPDLPNQRVALVVPQGCYYVLGDDRNNATDSRWWGCMPEQKIQGTVVKIARPAPKPRESTLKSNPNLGP